MMRGAGNAAERAFFSSIEQYREKMLLCQVAVRE
jgi:hypothetical protein